MSRGNATYLGDAVYASYDGYYIILGTDDHNYPSDRILLEPAVYEALVKFHAKVTGKGETPDEYGRE